MSEENSVTKRAYGTLYELEDGLLALLDTDDMVPDEQRGEYLAALQDQLEKTVEKRDAVARFMAHLESQQELVKAEVDRLQRLGKHFKAVEDRMKDTVRCTIQNLGVDAKGKYRKLEGKTCVLSLAKLPGSVEITDEEAVPVEYKDAVLTMPAATWQALMEDLFPEDREKIVAALRKQDLVVRKSDVKAALEGGEVPGARMSEGWRVVRK